MIIISNNYKDIEKKLIRLIIQEPEFVTSTMHERLQQGFTLLNPCNNHNDRSDYEYAEDFFQWILSGQTELSENVTKHNSWVKRFMDKTGLPATFSSSYANKIMSQLPIILKELANKDSRRAYINILTPDDQVILDHKTTHEFPCTIGLHFFLRDNELTLITNMRSNNVYSVMPYDVYNFTRLQLYVADRLKVRIGIYKHQMNSAHIYNGDVRRLRQSYF